MELLVVIFFFLVIIVIFISTKRIFELEDTLRETNKILGYYRMRFGKVTRAEIENKIGIKEK